MERHIELCGRWIAYSLERKRVKNINLRIKPDGSVAVSADRRVPVRVVEDFMRRKAETIIAALERFEQAVESAPPPLHYETGDRLLVFGRLMTLEVKQGKSGVREESGSLILTVTDAGNIELKKRTLDRWLWERLSRELEGICRSIYPSFQTLGVAYPELRLRRMRSRWGSCAVNKGVVTFNSHLAAVPRDCIEYVAVHEFTHFLRADHSPEFYRLLSGFLPDWRERKKKLAGYGYALQGQAH